MGLSMGLFAALWGITGILLLIGYALARLLPPTVEAFTYDFFWYHWAVLALNTAVALYLKGYRGFQRGLSPRVAARAKYIFRDASLVRLLLAPLFCLGYFHINRKKQIVTILMTVGMVFFILLVRLLAQPWRGIVDAGIVLGLGWGFISLLIFSFQAFTSKAFKYAPLVPDEGSL
jgi:uncharacterized membrane-anchored protein YitT (DUF2179 family)